MTSSQIQGYQGVDRVFSHVAISEVPKIYRSCDVIVKLSYVEGMFGPPLEMFHCGGTAIVYDVTGYDEYIKHNDNALVAKTGDEQSVVQYLRLLNSDRKLLSRLQQGALETAKNWIDWETSSKQFADALEKLTTPPFTAERKDLISQLVTDHLYEKIDIIFSKDNTQVIEQMTAKHKKTSSLYELLIPITAGRTNIGIIFGKNYKNLLITQLELIGMDDLASQAKLSYSLSNMVKDPDETYACQSTTGMLVASIEFNPRDNKNNVCQLRVEFMPVILWEGVPDRVAVS